MKKLTFKTAKDTLAERILDDRQMDKLRGGYYVQDPDEYNYWMCQGRGDEFDFTDIYAGWTTYSKAFENTYNFITESAHPFEVTISCWPRGY